MPARWPRVVFYQLGRIQLRVAQTQRALALAVVAVSTAISLPPDDVPRNDRIGRDGDPWAVGRLGKTRAQSDCGSRVLMFVLLCGPLRISAFSAFDRFSTQRTQRYAKGRREKPYCGVGDGDGEGRSEGGITAGFGLSGDECKWIAFHAVPTRLNTSVIRPDTLSGVPL